MYEIGFVCDNKEQADRLRKYLILFFEIEDSRRDGEYKKVERKKNANRT